MAVVIEHNLEVIKTADWIIDLGPEGGDGGCETVATGSPEDIAAVKRSYTGQFLAPVHGTKISLAADDVSPGRGPPEITKILPATTAAPRRWRAVGMRAWTLQPLPAGS